MKPRQHARRAVGCMAVAALLAVGCSGAPVAKALPPETNGRTTLYVSLGGDDNGGGRDNLAGGWPQLLFRSALPQTAVFVNLSNPRSGAAEILSRQVGVAAALRPDIVTITLIDDAERGTDPALVATDLDEVLGRLRADHAARVLVGTIPDGVTTPAATNALNAVITKVAGASDAAVVDLSATQGTSPELTATRIADAFATAIRAKRSDHRAN